MALIRLLIATSKSSESRAKIQFRSDKDLGIAAELGSRRTTGTSRLLLRLAWATSALQTCDATESGLMTKTNVSAASIAELISCIHSADGGMPSQSTQVLRPRCCKAS